MLPFDYKVSTNSTAGAGGRIQTGNVRASVAKTRNSASLKSSASQAGLQDSFQNGNIDRQILRQTALRKKAMANPSKQRKPVSAETRVKAHHLIGILSQFHWRGESKGKLMQVAVIGDSALEQEMRERLRGGGRFELVQVKNASDLEGVEMAYVNRQAPGADELLEVARQNKHTLTVETLLRDKPQRSTLGFITVRKDGKFRVRFRLNADNARQQVRWTGYGLVNSASIIFREDASGNPIEK